MQAQPTSSTRQFGIGPVKNIALALGVVATLAVGAATVAVTRNDDTAAVSQPARSVAVQPHAYSDSRFLEINQMPAAAVATTLSAERIRFLEMNEMPAVAAAVTLRAEQFRFLEMNQMPEAAVVATTLYETTRFLEINMLPEAPVVPVLHDTMRFIEINEMPVAPLVINTIDMRFWEINQLPGDNAHNLAPSADRLGERH